MLGLPPLPAGPTSFWTDQYGVRIQLVGDVRGADQLTLDGDPPARDFTAVLSRRGRVTGALLVGRPHDLPSWRRRLAEPTTERIAA
jgi:hypothetical protein